MFGGLDPLVPLTPRLQGIIHFLQKSTRFEMIADIGTDHAYVPIAACISGISKKAIACEANRGPLERAKKNILAYGLENIIETRQGCGFSPIRQNEADGAVIAGMGGMKIMEIISVNLRTARLIPVLILQPQHNITELRIKLHSLLFEITDETIVKEEHRFYFVMEVKPSENAIPWTEKEYYLGKHLLKHGGSVWEDYISGEYKKITKYINDMGNHGKKESYIKRKFWLEEALHGC